MAECADKIKQLLDLKQNGHITVMQFIDMSTAIRSSAAEPPSGQQQQQQQQAESSTIGQQQDDSTAGHGDNAGDEPVADDDGGAEPMNIDSESDASGDDDSAEVEEEKVAPSIMDFIRKHAPPAAKIAKPRKPELYKYKSESAIKKQQKQQQQKEQPLEVRNDSGRGGSVRKHGGRVNDVKAATMKLRLDENPNQTLNLIAGQLFCKACARNIGSSKQAAADHCKRVMHISNLKKLHTSSENKLGIQAAIHDFKEIIKEQHDDDAQVVGLQQVSEETQIARAEFLEEHLKAGVEPYKLDTALRPYFERTCGLHLVSRQHLVTTYMPPLKIT